MSERRRWLHGIPTLALAGFAIAAMSVVARAMAGRVPAGQIVFLRFAVGLVAVAAIFAVRRQGPAFARPRLLALRGLLGGLAATAYFVSLEHLEAGPASLLNNTAPAWATMCAAWFLGERMRPRGVVGIVLAMAGAALAVGGSVALSHWRLGVGVGAGLLSAVIAGGSLTALRALRSDTDSLTVLFSFCVVGVALTAPLAYVTWQPLEGDLLSTAVAVGLLSVIGQFLLGHGYRYVPVAVGSTAGLLTTVFAWAMGVALLGEGISARAMAGAAVCAAGVMLTARSAQAQPG
jgi:drug/metabolite transporter (DMT)-like permease